jgi:peptide/nickel transport system substrate-binding protein
VGDEGFVAKPIGAGPYKLVDYQRGSRIVLEAFDKYWGGAPSVKRAVFQILPEPSTRVAAVEAGRVDVATQLPFREAMRLQARGDLTVKIYPQAEIYMIQIPSYVETFQNANLRKALYFAIDKQALSKAFFNGQAKPLDVLALPKSVSDVPNFSLPHDKQRSIALLKAEGFGPGNRPKITLLCTNGTFPNDYEISRAIAAMWSAVGFDAIVEETTVAKYLELNHSAKLPGPMFYSWANPTGDPENDIGRILDPNLRFSAWKEPSLADRIAKLLSMKLSEERIEGYRSIAREASENAWSIPLLQTVGNTVSRKQVDVPTYAAGYILPAEITRKPG